MTKDTGDKMHRAKYGKATTAIPPLDATIPAPSCGSPSVNFQIPSFRNFREAPLYGHDG